MWQRYMDLKKQRVFFVFLEGDCPKKVNNLQVEVQIFISFPTFWKILKKNVPPNYIFEITCSFHLYLEEGLSQDLVL